MAKQPKLVSLSIRPSANGGHQVHHEFEPKAMNSRTRGMYMSEPAGADHTFGPGDHQNLMKHIVGALSLKGLEKAKSEQVAAENEGPVGRLQRDKRAQQEIDEGD